MKVATIKAYGRSYRINNPGSGRVGSRLNHGTPYERQLLQDVYRHQLTGTAFDVGAHVGNHALYLAAICEFRVLAWEPHDRSRGMLEDNLAMNPDLPIEVFSWAAGHRNTKGRFTPGKWLEFDPDRDGEKLKLNRGEVPVHPIDDLVMVEDLAVVKVDVEGMEPLVLVGMVDHLERNLPLVYTEAHTEEELQEIGKVLWPLGYQVTRMLHMGSRQVRWTHPDGKGAGGPVLSD